MRQASSDQSTMPVKDTTETLPVNNPLDAVSADLDASSLLKMYDLLPSEQPPSSTQTAGVFPVPAGLVADTAHRAAALDSGPPPPLQDAVGSLDQWTPPEPPVESMLLQPAPPPIATSVLDQGSKSEVKFTAVAVPAGELEEEERDGGGHDWEGLAESRIAVFEAKQKALRPDRRSSAKQVCLPTRPLPLGTTPPLPRPGSSRRGGGQCRLCLDRCALCIHTVLMPGVSIAC